MTKFQPQKAPSESVSEEFLASLEYPRYASPKLDGLRAVGHDHSVRSKTLKPFRNPHVNELFSHVSVTALDGELVVGSPYGGDVLSRTNSGVTSGDGVPDVRWHVFDSFLDPALPFVRRRKELPVRLKLVPAEARKRIVLVEHRLAKSARDVLAFEEEWLAMGYEGLMLNDPHAPYKFGRWSLASPGLLKFKRFVEAEVRVTAVEEGEHNLNEATLREDGVKRRSTRKEGRVGNGQVGRIIGKVVKTGRPITLGPGRMPVADRIYYLANPGKIVGKVVKARWFERPGFEPSYPNFQAFQESVERR